MKYIGMRPVLTFRIVPRRAPSGLSLGSVGPRTFPRKSRNIRYHVQCEMFFILKQDVSGILCACYLSSYLKKFWVVCFRCQVSDGSHIAWHDMWERDFNKHVTQEDPIRIFISQKVNTQKQRTS